MNLQVSNRIIDKTVQDLKEFGYEDVNRVTIFTKDVYREIFLELLESNDYIKTMYLSEYWYLVNKLNKYNS